MSVKRLRRNLNDLLARRLEYEGGIKYLKQTCEYLVDLQRCDHTGDRMERVGSLRLEIADLERRLDEINMCIEKVRLQMNEEKNKNKIRRN